VGVSTFTQTAVFLNPVVFENFWSVRITYIVVTLLPPPAKLRALNIGLIPFLGVYLMDRDASKY